MTKHTQYLRAEHEAAKQQTKMDTRTLKVNNKYRELYFDTRGGGKHFVTGEFCEPDVAPELVRRWNAFPDLLAALEQLEATATKINNIQHSGRRVPSTEWSALYSDSAFARAAINKAKTL